MSEMLHKVARAICWAERPYRCDGGCKKHCEALVENLEVGGLNNVARAALVAIKEPNDAMLEAVRMFYEHVDNNANAIRYLTPAVRVHCAMIDEILK